MKVIPCEAINIGMVGKYPGSFGSGVEKAIKSVLNKGPVLHLYSGSSFLGDTGVDIAHKNATINKDIFDFIQTEEAQKAWEWIILDPPYKLQHAELKLKAYGNHKSLSGNVLQRRLLVDFFLKYGKNILWLDYSAPRPKGFFRKKLWLILPGSYHSVRCLSWLKREGHL